MRGREIERSLQGLLADENGTSDVEYILITAFIVLPLFAMPALIMRTNAWFFERVVTWTNLPFP